MGVVKIHRDFEIENISFRKTSQIKDKNISRINYLLQYGKYQSTLDVEDIDFTAQDATSLQKTCLEHTKENDNTIPVNDDLEAAKVFFHKHFFSMFVCMLTGLYTLMFIPSIARLLFYTKKSDNPIKAFNRYLSTLNHTVQWYFSPKERTKSLKKVRKLHAMAVKQTLSKVKDENCVVTDNGAVPMSQFDLVVTQWAFIGAALTRPKSIGLCDVTTRELHLLTNQMYKVGRDLGISNEFNLCSGTLEETIQYAKDIENYVIIPALELNQDFESMAGHLMKGVNILNPFIDPLAFSAWTHKIFGAQKSYHKRREMLVSYKSRIFYHLHDFLFEWVLKNNFLNWVVIGFFNTLMDLTGQLHEKFRILRNELPI